MKDIAIYGGGGFGREVACIIKRINSECKSTWNIIGFFDDGLIPGNQNEYGEILGNIETLNSWKEPLSVVFAIGSPKIVELLHSKIVNPLVDFPNIIAPDVLFYNRNSFKIGKGNILCPRCIVSCNVEIGDFNSFGGHTDLGHDSKVGSFNSIMPAVQICGGVKIGNRNFVGINAIVLQYNTIGDNTSVGVGSVIMKDTLDGFKYFGNPARPLKM